MPRTVYLIVYNSPLFPAHWALWIPRANPPNLGKLIHATGDARNGFTIAFEPQVLDHYAVDVTGDGSRARDQTAHDYLEQVALSIAAPGASLVSATSSGPRQRIAIPNCQTWLRQVVVALVQNGVMGEEVIQIIDSAPKN